MNGEPIPPPNGGPVRMVVPGWAGIASVKWPVRIEVVNTPFQGYWNAERYIIVDGNGQTLRSVREMPVKSVIAWPREGDAVRAGVAHCAWFRLVGFWADRSGVDVSADDQRPGRRPDLCAAKARWPGRVGSTPGRRRAGAA